MRFKSLVTAVGGTAVLAAVLTGCTVPRPDVTFYGHFKAVNVGPALWCSQSAVAAGQSCNVPQATDAGQIGSLPLRAGDGVQINVPADIYDTPWVVVIFYADAAAQLHEARTGVFLDKETATTVRPPSASDRIVRVEVQSGIVLGTDGTAVATHSWVVVGSGTS